MRIATETSHTVGLKLTAMNSKVIMRPLLNRQLRANSLPGESIHIGSVLHCRSTNAFTSENFKSRNTEVSVSLAIEKPFWYEKLLKCVHTPGLTRFWVDSPRMHLLHQLLSYCAFLCMGSMRHAKPVACCADALALQTSTIHHQLNAVRVIHLPHSLLPSEA